MLVEMMNRMMAISQMYSAQNAIMRNNFSMQSYMSNMNSFAPTQRNYQQAARMDEQFAVNKEINEMRYMLAKAQYDASKKSTNNRLSYTA